MRHEDTGVVLQAGKVRATPTVAATKLVGKKTTPVQPPTTRRLEKDSRASLKT